MLMIERVEMKGSEWMKKMLDGERDFSRVRIIGEDSVLEHTEMMNSYLSSVNLEKEPLIFDLADLSGVHAPTIYAPYTKFRGVRAFYINLARAYLEHSDFGPYVNPNGSETRSVLVSATLDDVHAAYATWTKARFNRASVARADFSHGDLCGVDGWATMKMLGTVNDYDVKVDEYGHDMLVKAKSHRICDTVKKV